MRRPVIFIFSVICLTRFLYAGTLDARSLSTGGLSVEWGDKKTRDKPLGLGINSTPARISRREFLWDEFPKTNLVFDFGNEAAFEVRIENFSSWRLRDGKPFPFAVTFDHPLAPRAILGINHVTGPAAQSVFTGACWDDLPSSLTHNPKDRYQVLVNDHSTINGNIVQPLGWQTRVYERIFTSALPDVPPQTQIYVIFGTKQELYLVTLEGPTSMINAVKPDFKLALQSFNLPPKP